MRYLLRPPLSLRPKYAAFLLDFARQSDHMHEVLGRAAEGVGDDLLAQVLRSYQKEERLRTQLVLSDLRLLGHPPEDLPKRPLSAGDAALRAYCTNVSYERPVAMLGVVLMFIGLSAEISPTIVRLLTVGAIPKETMRWLGLREITDAPAFDELCQQLARTVRDPAHQAAMLEAVEVSGELLALGAAARQPV